MRRDFGVYLHDILKAGESIQRFLIGIDCDTFAALEEKQAAVERKFEIMGEAISQCRIHHAAEASQLGDVQGVVDFRNYLAHRYHLVKSELVWDIVENDLPPLLERIRSLIQARNTAPLP